MCDFKRCVTAPLQDYVESYDRRNQTSMLAAEGSKHNTLTQQSPAEVRYLAVDQAGTQETARIALYRCLPFRVFRIVTQQALRIQKQISLLSRFESNKLQSLEPKLKKNAKADSSEPIEAARRSGRGAAAKTDSLIVWQDPTSTCSRPHAECAELERVPMTLMAVQTDDKPKPASPNLVDSSTLDSSFLCRVPAEVVLKVLGFLTLTAQGQKPALEYFANSALARMRLTSKRYCALATPLLFSELWLNRSAPSLDSMPTVRSYFCEYLLCLGVPKALFIGKWLDDCQRLVKVDMQLSDEIDVEQILSALAALPCLRHLRLSGTSIEALSLGKWLGGCQRLVKVEMQVSDDLDLEEIFSALAGLPCLHYLVLSGTYTITPPIYASLNSITSSVYHLNTGSILMPQRWVAPPRRVPALPAATTFFSTGRLHPALSDIYEAVFPSLAVVAFNIGDGDGPFVNRLAPLFSPSIKDVTLKIKTAMNATDLLWLQSCSRLETLRITVGIWAFQDGLALPRLSMLHYLGAKVEYTDSEEAVDLVHVCSEFARNVALSRELKRLEFTGTFVVVGGQVDSFMTDELEKGVRELSGLCADRSIAFRSDFHKVGI